MTNADLIAEIRKLAIDELGKPMPRGLSKMRKSELETVRNTLREAAEAKQESDDIDHATPAELTVTVPALGTFEANSFLAAVGCALSADLTEQDRHDLDMAKYRGRYEGKAVCVGSMRGKVVGGVHRDSDPTGRENGTLLLSVKHDRTRYGHPRVTLHRAADVVLV